MRSIAKYQEQVRTIFCDGCGGTVLDVPIKDAPKLLQARQGKRVVCDECLPHMKCIAELERSKELRASGHAAAIDVRQKAFEEDMKSMSAQQEVARGALEQIRLKRLQQYDWQSKTN